MNKLTKWFNRLSDDQKFFAVIGAILLTVAFIGVGVWVLGSYKEAQIFSELTGKRVTTSQAMWVDLRVIEPAKAKE